MHSLLARGPVASRPANRPASLPIFVSSGWEFDSAAQADAVFSGSAPGAGYGNRNTPNHEALETMLRDLEGAEACLITSGGMSAITSMLFGALSAGSHVIAGRDLFGPTHALLLELGRWGVETTFVDLSDSAALRAAFRPNTRLVYAETISNPMMRVADLGHLAAMARDARALLAVDNTFASPYHCKPLALGADIVVESATKMLSGHHDVIIGSVAGTRAAIETARTHSYLLGTRPGAFDAWLSARGLVTFALRQERAASNAAVVADWLSRQSFVKAVHYPGLTTHPDHAVAERQLVDGFGSIMAFELDGGMEHVDRFLAALTSITLVHSLGGHRTTLSHAATMTHRSLSAEARMELGLHDGFLRLAVGLEDADDIVADLATGLAAAGRRTA